VGGELGADRDAHDGEGGHAAEGGEGGHAAEGGERGARG
jgi:hypothetical protein